MKASTLALTLFFAFVVYQIGYAVAHHTVGKECEKLGGFYVESRIYECHRKETP